MYRSIVVPLDGSPFGNGALPVAIALASRCNAEVHLVHVREPVLFLEGSSTYEPHLADDHQMKVRAHMTTAAAHLSREASLRVDAEFLDGHVVPTLRQYLEDGDHDLVVMMTHGRGGWNRAWLGSVADGLIRTAPVPLLLLRHDSQWLRDAVEPLFRRILIPLDGSAMAEEVLDPVLSLGTLDTTEYVLLSVIAPHREIEPGDAESVTGRSHDEQQREAAHNYLNRVAGDLRIRGALVKVSVEVYGHTSQGILHAAAEYQVDMIALSTHGRGSLSRLMHGSVADKILRGADVPVFVYRPALAGAEQSEDRRALE